MNASMRATLAPTGALRVGVYRGSPSSLVANPDTGETAGLAHDLGYALAGRLGVPMQLLEFARPVDVVEAIGAGAADFTVTNASESRARLVDFTPTIVRLELGYLVPAGSPIASIDEVDRPGRRIGVTQGSTSQGTLGRQFTHAALVPAASMEQARQMLCSGAIDAFATNKAILFELAGEVTGTRVLDGRWGLEQLAMAIPKGRAQVLAPLEQFARDMRASGRLAAMIARAGLRGTAPD